MYHDKIMCIILLVSASSKLSPEYLMRLRTAQAQNDIIHMPSPSRFYVECITV